MKILTIIGARPQFVKASVVSRALSKCSGVKEVLVHTGQHFDTNMSKIFFEELDIPEPHFSLGISGGSHGEMTGRMIIDIEKILIKEKPDSVLLYGDTNSTLAGAIAASKLYVPIIHVEAGLRSFNNFMPEEINRILTDRVSSLLFTPTSAATKNLLAEGFDPGKIFEVGDVMYDAAMFYSNKIKNLDRHMLRGTEQFNGYILVTIHRAENTDSDLHLESIVSALVKISVKSRIIWPVHPRTLRSLSNLGLLDRMNGKVQIIEPVGYIDMLHLQKNAILIVTDSGGVQKEAFFAKVPCVTVRNETEWVELLESGWNRLVPPSSAEVLFDGIESAIGTRGSNVSLYGDGKASDLIIEKLLK